VIIIIGGGPAGFFAAVTVREHAPRQPVLLLERGRQVLRKVAISGGGRCNVTSGCEDALELVGHYPRGGRELRGPFSRFSTRDTRRWFEERGVPLKVEGDGRVFPVSDKSASVVDCLRRTAQELGVEVRTGVAAKSIEPSEKGLNVLLADQPSLAAEAVLLATGGTGGHELVTALGHTIEPLVPSLFTFNCTDELLRDIPGVAVPRVVIRAQGQGLPKKGLEQEGPLLVTHWGLSGPAVLRLSAWGARLLHGCDYRFRLRVDWCPALDRAQAADVLAAAAADTPRKQLGSRCPVEIPRRLWAKLLERAGLGADRPWGEVGKKGQGRLLETLKATELAIEGKSTFKEEFVTCGGVNLAEVDFKTMASRLVPGLFFAGEVLDIDGVTGGFNFQACWTTGRLAGLGMANIREGD
jgi:predicted Rossmann fold flavoprotein